MGIFSSVKNKLLNVPGWHTSHKLLAIESDDWGSIRMPSRDAFAALEQAGADLSSGDSLRYNKFDTLATKNDFEALFSVLRKHRDRRGNHPVITAMALVANPDFSKIRESNFRQYYYEAVDCTLERYYPGEDVFSCWQRGINEKIFIPQFHGREHLNVSVWLQALRDGDPHTHLAFEHGMWGFNNIHRHGISYQAAFHLGSAEELSTQQQILTDGLELFERLFGYRASFFVPPNGILPEEHYGLLKASGVEYLFSSRLHQVPVAAQKFKRRFNYLGKKTSSGQRFIIRNAFFEPSLLGKDWVNDCLQEISYAFKSNRPAIISSHRINYIGALDVSNRDNGLKALDKLLSKVCLKWKDVEFVSSHELGELMNGRQNES